MTDCESLCKHAKKCLQAISSNGQNTWLTPIMIGEDPREVTGEAHPELFPPARTRKGNKMECTGFEGLI